MTREEEFFHSVSKKVLDLTEQRFEKTKEIKYKGDSFTPDIATEGDFDNETLIKAELTKFFPNDQILAEETSPNTSYLEGRVWIVDPICGSFNFKSGIRLFSTNIALSDNGELIASCVIDHSRKEYIWSTGNQTISIGSNIVKPEVKSKGVSIEVDLSAVMGQPLDITNRQLKLVRYILENKKYYLASFNTSLGFAYCALGRINAYANGHSKVWDVAAANFLTLQAGGVVTQMDGEKWDLKSNNVLGSISHELHKELLEIINY